MGVPTRQPCVRSQTFAPGGRCIGKHSFVDSDSDDAPGDAPPEREAAAKPTDWSPHPKMSANVEFWFTSSLSRPIATAYSALHSMQRGSHCNDLPIGWCMGLVAKRASSVDKGLGVRTASIVPTAFQTLARAVGTIPGTRDGGKPHYPLDELDCVLLTAVEDGHFSLAALCHPGESLSLAIDMQKTRKSCNPAPQKNNP